MFFYIYDFKGYIIIFLLRTPKHLEHKLTLELEFRSLLPTCTLLYSHQDEDGLGDFLSVSLILEFVELRYNLGDGFVVIKSMEPVQLGTWNRIVIKRLVFPYIYTIDHRKHNFQGNSVFPALRHNIIYTFFSDWF